MGDTCCAEENEDHNSNCHLSKDCCDNESFLIEAVDFVINSEVEIPSINVQNSMEEHIYFRDSIASQLSIIGQDEVLIKDHYSQRLFCVYRL